jgi:hypothetical protein
VAFNSSPSSAKKKSRKQQQKISKYMLTEKMSFCNFTSNIYLKIDDYEKRYIMLNSVIWGLYSQSLTVHTK